jgi:hypothetical protein
MDKQKKLIKSWNNVYVVPSRQLDRAVTTCQVCVQQYHPRIYSTNPIQGSTQQIPFFVNYEYHPKYDQFDFNKVENPAAKDLTTRLSKIHTEMKDKLLEAQDQQKDSTDKS